MGRQQQVVGADGTTRDGLRRLYAAVIVTGLGEGVFWIALVGLLADEPRFELLLTVAVVARLAPRALFSYAAGRWLDRADVRTVLIATEGSRGVLFVGLALGIAAGAPVWLVLLGVFVAYTIAVPTRPAVMAVLPRLAGETQLAAAATTLSTIRQLVTFAGPLLGVAVVAASIPLGFAVKGVTFIVSAVLFAGMTGVRWPGRNDRATTPASDEQPTATSPWQPGMVGVVTLVGGMYAVRGAEMVLYVLVLTELIGAPATSLGYLSGGTGLGALLAAPAATWLVARFRPATTVWASVLLTAAPTAVLAVLGSVLLASAATAVVGAAMVVFEVVTVLTLQRATPEGGLGTVFGAVGSASSLGMLLGALLVPGLAALVGVDGALVAVAAGLVLVAALTTPAVVRAGRVAADRRDELQPVVDVLAQVPLFADAARPALERVAASVTDVAVARGDLVLRQGEEADACYVVRSGDLEVLVDDRRVNVVGAGGWIGEIGLVDRVPRTATVRALTPVALWRIPGPVFLDALADAGTSSVLLDGMAARSARGRAG